MKNELQRLSDLLELENTLEYKARQQAYAAALTLTAAWTRTHRGVVGEEAIEGIKFMFINLSDYLTERMIKDGKALEQAQAAESNTTQVAHS